MRKGLLGLLIVLLAASFVWAQARTGNIYGKVVDTTGAPLPGVSVTLTSDLVGTLTTVTSSEGNFRFLSLPPGFYNLKFELPGFKSVERKGIRVSVGKNVTLRIVMEQGKLEEKVEVTAAAPVVDTMKTTTAANVTREALQELPTARDPWVILQLAPGVMVDRVNVGGSESGQQSSYTARGMADNTSRWNVDGVDITDEAALGASPMYYDFDAFEEIQIQTAAQDVTAPTGGVQINFVTRRGGNKVSGGARVFVTNENWQAELTADRGNFATVNIPGKGAIEPLGNKIKSITDYGFNIGGPIIKDKLWIWGAYGVQDLDIYSFTGDRDDTWLENVNLKLNATLGIHRLEFLYTWGNKEKEGRRRTGGYLDTREATFHQTGPTGVYKIQDEFTIGNNLFVSLKFGYVGGGFELDPYGGRYTPTRRDIINNIRWGSNWYYYTQRPQYTASMTMNYFAEGLLGADHEIKIGAEYKYALVDSTWNYDGATYDYLGNVPYRVIIWRGWNTKYYGQRISAYIQDTITAGKLTINLGVRYDRMFSASLEKEVPGTNFDFARIGGTDYNLPSVTTVAQRTPFTYNFFSPRIGIIYDLTGEGTTVFKANFAIYGDVLPAWYGDQLSIPLALQAFMWTDLNGDDNPQANELIPWWSYEYPLKADPEHLFDPELTPTKTMEILVGVEHELFENFGVGSNFIYRRIYDTNWSVPWVLDLTTGETRLIQPNDWFIAGYTSSGYAYWDVHPWIIYLFEDYTTKRPDYYRYYWGIEFYFKKRLSNRWMLDGSVTIQDTRNRFPTRDSYIDPTNHEPEDLVDNTPFAAVSGGSGAVNVHMHARWLVKLAGLYQLPYGFNLSGTFIAREGYIVPVYDIDYGYIRMFDYSFPSTYAKRYGEERLPTFWMINLRLEKKVSLGEMGNAYISADLFNVTNNSMSLGREANVQSVNYLKDLQVVNPRVVRFGFRIEF